MNDRVKHRDASGGFTVKSLFLFMAIVLITAVPKIAVGKSLYLIANHHTAQFDAWDIGPSGTVTYQATYNLAHATDPAGVTVWEDPASNDAVLFVTSEFSLAGVELVDATTMTSLGYATADTSDLAGIDVEGVVLVDAVAGDPDDALRAAD